MDEAIAPLPHCHHGGEAARFALFATVREEVILVTAGADVGYFNMLGQESRHQQLVVVSARQVNTQTGLGGQLYR